jgi:hypothetical protein
MLKKIIDQLANRVKLPLFDPSAFQDPVAIKTSWTPLRNGGSNFKTAVLLKIDEQRMEFRSSVAMKLMALAFMIAGLAIGASFAAKKPEQAKDYIPVAIGLVFAGVGAGLLRHATTPNVFDLRHGYYCKSRQKPELMMDPSKLKHYAELKRVHALQIISEHVRGDKKSYYSYELNLVLDDGSRINVVDHGNHLALRTDSETLAQFLNKPLWDASM